MILGSLQSKYSFADVSGVTKIVQFDNIRNLNFLEAQLALGLGARGLGVEKNVLFVPLQMWAL